MFTCKVVIKLNGLILEDAVQIADRLGIIDILNSAWFELMRHNIDNGNIKDFKFESWDVNNQESTSIFYSDTAEQCRAFQHSLLNSQDFVGLATRIQQQGHDMTVDMGISPQITLEKRAVDLGFRQIKFSI
jgi:hypothetical protein